MSLLDGQFNDNTGLRIPFGVPIGSDYANVKAPHDQYDVFVNGDLVGHKVLLNQVDDVQDVSTFLHSRGLRGFSAKLAGDHYELQVSDAETADKIRENLNVYLHIR